MLIDMDAFTQHLKDNSLMHVHFMIDSILVRFRKHKCVHGYIHEVLSIREVSPYLVKEYVVYINKKTHGKVKK